MKKKETGNVGYTKHKTKTNKTICIGHHYANTNNVNKKRVLQTTGGKDELNIIFRKHEKVCVRENKYIITI
jgi:hypothetical protein